MAIYARRRLQQMLDELGPAVPGDSVNHLLNRLDHEDATTALAAEAELSLLWALDQVSHIVVEPELPNSRSRIEAIALDLLASGPAAVEVRAISDRKFSGQKDMERAANIISQFANGIKKEASTHLFFTFGSGFVVKKGRQRRVRFISEDYALTPEHKEQLKAWIGAYDWPSPRTLSLVSDKISVVIRWEKFVHPAGRVFCSMPAVADDLKDNPLYRALKSKDDQMSGVPAWITRCVFIADAGSHLLWSSHRMGVSTKTAEDIVWSFLNRSKIDVVCLFSPRRELGGLMGSLSRAPRWNVRIFDRRKEASPTEHSRLHALANALPNPSLEGYQARQRYQQGGLQATSSGRYRAGKITTSKGSMMSIEISARLVHELMAGQLCSERFQYLAFGEATNFFAKELTSGRTLQSVRLLPREADNDDDLLVFEFAADPAASPLRPPSVAPIGKRIRSWLLRRILEWSLRAGIPLRSWHRS